MNIINTFNFLGLLALTLIACHSNSQTTHELMPPQTSVMDMMKSIVEPTTNSLWAVAMDENIPKTDAQWKALEDQSIQLISVSAALSLGGSGPMDTEWSKDERWQAHLQQMAEIGSQFLLASRNKNYLGLLDAGEILIEPCGNCHTDFPGQGQ